LGTIDVLVVNVGIATVSRLSEIDLNAFGKLQKVKLPDQRSGLPGKNSNNFIVRICFAMRKDIAL